MRSSVWRLAILFCLAIELNLMYGQSGHTLPLQGGAPILGEPFSAVRTLDYEPTSGTSDPKPFHAEQATYRDSQGRTRSETKYPSQPETIDILDPVAHLHYHWTLGETVVLRAVLKEIVSVPPVQPSKKFDADEPEIEGVPTRHSRSTKQTPDHGAETIESWYAPSLHLALMTIIDSPTEGKTTYRFQHLSLGEPDAALFRAPSGLEIRDRDGAPPPVKAVSNNSSAKTLPSVAAGPAALPHSIKDDNYLEALSRFHAAVPRWLPLQVGYHQHTDFRMIDLNGQTTSASRDRWHLGQVGRDEESAPGWHSIIVWAAEQNWSEHDGMRPMRLAGLFDVDPRPAPMERRIRIFGKDYVTLKLQEVDGVLRRCSSVFGGAEICFDPVAGFPNSASLDDERVVYEEWGEFAGKRFPSRWAVNRGDRLQMEARTTVTNLDSSAGLFDPLPGVDPRPNRLGAQLEDADSILSRGDLKPCSFGQALVKVFVGQNGRVERATLIDADDKSLGAAALNAAKHTVYFPRESEGQSISYETAFRIEHWSSVDPIRIGSTSLTSQGTD